MKQPPEHSHPKRWTHQKGELRLILLAVFVVVCLFNLQAVIDTVFHPEIPYLAAEHLLVGGISALLAMFLAAALLGFSRRENGASRRKAPSLRNRSRMEHQDRAEEALMESEERFSTFMDHLPGIAFIKDSRSRYIYMNRVAQEIFQLGGKQWDGKTAAELFSHESGVQRSLDDQSVLTEGAMVRREDSDIRDGRRTDWLINKFPMRGKDGSTTYVGGIGVEITDRKRMEEALKQSEKRLANAQRIAKVGDWHWDYTTNVITWSDEIYRICGLDRTRFTPTAEGFKKFLHPDDLAAMSEDDFERAVLNKDYDAEYRIIDQSTGAIKHISVHAEATLNVEGAIEHIAGTLQDISERKRADAARLELEKQVLQTQKLESLGLLAGGIAHDFNNILMAILGYADLAMAEIPETHPARDSMGEIMVGVKRAAELTRQMLAYSGRGRFVIKELNLTDLIDEMAHLLRTSISKKITLNLQLEPGLPMIEADTAQLQQVILNLIVNASEAIGDETGAISLSTGVRECDAQFLGHSIVTARDTFHPGSYVYFEVVDSGCGMNEETKARMFDPFFTTKFTGRGLGMAAVLGIVRGHRGAMLLETQPGEGTTFRVLFPTAKPAIQVGQPERAVETRGAWMGSGTILVVDDEAAVRDLTTKVLKRRGFLVLTAKDGEEGLELFRRNHSRIDCVILDLTMPKMGGEETFRRMRQVAGEVKVILSSGYSKEEMADRFAGKGVTDFIHKPYRSAKLLAAIREVLSS